MIKFFKSLFGANSAVTKLREITSPKQLRKGDMFEFRASPSLPEELSGHSFEVKKVATYFYTDCGVYEYTIKDGQNKPLFLSIEDFDGEEHIIVSKKLKRKDVEQALGTGVLAKLVKQSEIDALDVDDTASTWLAKQYHCKAARAKGVYFEKAIRDLDQRPSGGEAFEYFEFYSDDETRSFEIEVWEGNEIEVCHGVVLPFTSIANYWCGNQH